MVSSVPIGFIAPERFENIRTCTRVLAQQSEDCWNSTVAVSTWTQNSTQAQKMITKRKHETPPFRKRTYNIWGYQLW